MYGGSNSPKLVQRYPQIIAYIRDIRDKLTRIRDNSAYITRIYVIISAYVRVNLSRIYAIIARIYAIIARIYAIIIAYIYAIIWGYLWTNFGEFEPP